MMGGVESCCRDQKDDMLLVTKMDLSHCGCTEVPNIVFNAERCIETLILASNQISSLPPQLFHCQELKHLNLIDNCISSIPPAIGSLMHLVSLKLDKNNLKDLPENLKCCRKLKRLSLNNNLWKQVPCIATQLISLEELYMNDCELNFLPASIGRLTKLRVLELRNNNLCNLPLSIARLTSLSRLDIGDNEFTEFPASVNSLKNLHELLMDNNDIDEIGDIKNLGNLEHFDASYNHITNISETIGNCTNINMLNLSFNYLGHLPDSVGNIEKLETLHLEMNELTEIPKTIGNLRNLEDLNISNNRLCNIPISVGLLRNLRTFNVSKNTIQEFPSEIGSCTRLTIINAGYNRLQVLPSEIGYLNNLKVLDLVGNFLMYLPITIINLRNIRAIWLSANQNVPLIPFTEDLNIASGERFLTNIALPQLGEIPLYNSQNNVEKKEIVNEKSGSWGKKIRFAEDDDILPGKLLRTPTPFPKELRAPNRKQHVRNEGLKNNDDYVNLIDGKAFEPELQPPTVPITKSGSGLLNFTESCVTMIREANIRKNNKDLNLEKDQEQYFLDNALPDYDSEVFSDFVPDPKNSNSIKNGANVSLKDDSPFTYSYDLKQYNKGQEFLSSNSTKNQNFNNQPCAHAEKLEVPSQPLPGTQSVLTNSQLNEKNENCIGERNIYSNVIRDENFRPDIALDHEYIKGDAQKVREIPHNDLTSERNGNLKSGDKPSINSPLKSSVCNESNKLSSQGGSYLHEKKSRPDICSPNDILYNKVQQVHPYYRNKTEKTISKEDMMVMITEKMRSKNMSPPCYEIAKMYSTKAALFEQNRIENCN